MRPPAVVAPTSWRPEWPGPSATATREPDWTTESSTGWAAAGRRYEPTHEPADAFAAVSPATVAAIASASLSAGLA